MRDVGRLAASAMIALATITDRRAAAQERVTARADVLLYGDNTEFRNPFREGETLFGAAARAYGDIELTPRVTLSLGVFGNQRFGGDDAFELVRPIVALTVSGAKSSFVFGAFPARRADAPAGPDRMGPHGLLPALQRETLSFERAYEPGLRWTFRGSLIEHEMWLAWQRLNTPEHRERLDAGVSAALGPRAAFSVPVQLHVVHQGGQLFASGAVADSVAAAAGIRFERPLGPATRGSLETFALVSRHVPDRAEPDRSRDGAAFLARAALEHGGWRAHFLAWRGRDFIKDEADPNYLSIRRDGGLYRGTRDYAEIGAARRFQLAPAASLEVSARLHRVEHYYEYSYRVTSAINVAAPLR